MPKINDRKDRAKITPPNMSPIDTIFESRQGDDLVIAAMSQWSLARKAKALNALISLVRGSSRQAWRARNPDKSVLEADIDWAENQYGDEIGAALRRRLLKNK
jgi:hypothetical protein